MAVLEPLAVLLVLPARGGTVRTSATSDVPASGTTSPGTDAGVVKQTAKVGVAFRLSGLNGNYGLSQQRGAQLAADEINAARYIPGADLHLLNNDDGGTPESGTALFQKFLNDDHVLAIIGPTLSNVALRTDPLAKQAKTLVLAVSNTVAGITDIGDHIFRDSLSEAQVIPQTIKVSKAKLGYKRVPIIYGNDEAFSTAGYQYLNEELTAEGVGSPLNRPSRARTRISAPN
jgi:branched-chain amino acid transport system substrate-binding protein